MPQAGGLARGGLESPAGGALSRHAPDVAATSVPAGDLSSDSSIRGALAHNGSGAAVLQRVVKVCDRDDRIPFDMPARI